MFPVVYASEGLLGTNDNIPLFHMKWGIKDLNWVVVIHGLTNEVCSREWYT